MEANSFLTTISENSSKSLIFDFAGQKINKGYHVTEFKAVDIKSVDCGGKSNDWSELVLHLTAPPNNSDASYMSGQKFLEIYQRVATTAMNNANTKPIDDSLMRVEFAANDGIAISYIVDSIDINEDSILVKTLAPGTTCKATDYLAGNVPLASTVSKLGCC